MAQGDDMEEGKPNRNLRKAKITEEGAEEKTSLVD